MTIKRVNSTGRKRILREDVSVRLCPAGRGATAFDVFLSLKEYDLPDNAFVFVEAYRQTTFMRFPFGTVGGPKPPAGSDLRLTEFATTDAILFRVKVTSADKDGMLLAEGDKIPLGGDGEQPEDRIPLLPSMPSDLGQESWRVDFSDPGPVLVVNDRAEDWKAVATSSLFRSLVFPAALRQVLWNIYMRDDVDPEDIDDIAGWPADWLKFASSLPGVGVPPGKDGDEWKRWVDEAVESFCRQHRFFDHFSSGFSKLLEQTS